MRTPFAFAALAAMLTLPTAPAHAGPADYIGTTCGLAATYDGRDSYSAFSGAMSAAVTASDSTTTVEITCLTRLNGVETLFEGQSVQVGPSAVVAFTGANTWPFELDGSVVDVCTTITVGGVLVHYGCRAVVRTPVAPVQVCDLPISFECPDEEEWHLVPEPVSG